MSREHFDERCAGCRPALVDMKTGQVMAADDPSMKAVNAVWDGTTKAEREAWHRVTCQNSRATVDLKLAEAVAMRVQAALNPKQG